MSKDFEAERALEQSRVSQARDSCSHEHKASNYRDYVERREHSRQFNESLGSGYESKYLTKQDEKLSTLAKKPFEEKLQTIDEFQFSKRIGVAHNGGEKSLSNVSYVRSRDHSGPSEQGHESIAEMRIKREESAR